MYQRQNTHPKQNNGGEKINKDVREEQNVEDALMS